VAGIAVGLVGYGAWGRHILRDLVVLGCDVTVVARGEEGRREAGDAGAVGCVAHVDELPAELRGIVVATTTSTHADVVESLLPRDVPLFVEKPLTDNAAAAAHLARAAGDRLFVMHKWRYHPGIQLLGEIARSQELGPIVGLRTTRVGWGTLHADVDPVWILLPHELSIALEVLGEIPEPQSAVAEKVNGTLAGLVGRLGKDPWVVVEVSATHPRQRREVRLICRDGVVTLLDPYADHVLVTRGEVQGDVTRIEEVRSISTEFPLLRELRAFVAHLEGGPPPKSSAAEGASEVAAIERLRQLAQTEAGS
jgi:predicted dehydrogenase